MINSSIKLALFRASPAVVGQITSRTARGAGQPFLRPQIWLVRSYSRSSSYKSPDSTIETDEILSENNPWSPTLLEDPVKVRKPGSFMSTSLPSNFRLSYAPLYEAPGSKYVSLLKRLTISFGILGMYGAKLFWESPHFDDIYAITLATASTVPALVVQYKTRDYVTRIFRLYDKSLPQTLPNLVKNEGLIMEKLNFAGGRTYNTLLKVADNKSLKLANPRAAWLQPYQSWQDVDDETNTARKYYVVDDIGGMKMDRIWGIVEHNSGLDNGRYIPYDPDEQQR